MDTEDVDEEGDTHSTSEDETERPITGPKEPKEHDEEDKEDPETRTTVPPESEPTRGCSDDTTGSTRTNRETPEEASLIHEPDAHETRTRRSC